MQREETLLKDIRKVTQERDDARAQALREKSLETELGAERARAEGLQSELQASQKEKANTGQIKSDLEQARKDAETTKAQLMDLKADLSLERSEVKKLRQVREDHEAALAKAKTDAALIDESRAEALKWREAALDAAKQVKGSLKILVTAPKVSINVGMNEFGIHKAITRDIEQIKGVIGDNVLPGFQRIVAVAEEQGEQEVRKCVQNLVEELAQAVQQEVYRALPQAEGTASWDGFGSKLVGLK